MGPEVPGKRPSRSFGGYRPNLLQKVEVAMWGRPLLTLRAVSVECREPRGYWEGVRERVGGQEAEAVCINFFFRMCGVLKEGIVLVIKGRASGNSWRKSVGRGEGAGQMEGPMSPGYEQNWGSPHRPASPELYQ